MQKLSLLTIILFLTACNSFTNKQAMSITAYSDELASVIDLDANINILAEGFEWSEGPVWVNDAQEDYLLFSDVPQNKIYRWSERAGLSVFMEPSGYDGDYSAFSSEPGTNGLILSGQGSLIAANHGERELSLIDLNTATRSTLVDEFEGKSFNSPNDVAMANDGALYFTDPPYGLTEQDESSYKELDFNGVYRYNTDASVTVIDQTLARPNGIGLSADNRTLIVANSDETYPIWKKYTLNAQGIPERSVVMYNARAEIEAGEGGLPDGLVVDAKGNVFGSGPGGIYIFSPEGKLMGKINTGRSAANCTFGGKDGSTLFITADDVLLSVQTLTKGQ